MFLLLNDLTTQIRQLRSFPYLQSRKLVKRGNIDQRDQSAVYTAFNGVRDNIKLNFPSLEVVEQKFIGGSQSVEKVLLTLVKYVHNVKFNTML